MPRHSMQGSAISIVRHNRMACSATPFSRDWQQSQRIYLGRAPMAATSNRERAVKVVLVVLGLFTVVARSEEHTSELQSRLHLVCRLLLEKKKKRQLTLIFNLLH